MLKQANKLIFAKCYAEAEKLLEPIVENFESPENSLAQLRYIELAIKQNKLQQLCDSLRKQYKQNPNNKILLLMLNLSEQLGDFITPDIAIDRHMDYIQTYGAHAGAYYGIGFSLESKGEYKRAKYNYQQSLNEDPNWHPSLFGLSQICYKMGDEKRGDQYFYMFEEVTPYNVYGNFETHRTLSNEFLAQKRFSEAIECLKSLSAWWIQNKGTCPVEIEIFEYLAEASIEVARNNETKATQLKDKAKETARGLLESIHTNPEILYFTAKILEDFSEKTLALSFYKKVLSSESSDPMLIQKIGGQLLSSGNYNDALTLFEEAYQHHPDNPEIRFCLLVSKMKLADVNIEEYLMGKERMRRLKHSQGDKVELLALLHSLLAKFPDDPEVHAYIGDVYLNLGNKNKAETHFKKMYSLESKSKHTIFKFAHFITQHSDLKKAREVIDHLKGLRNLNQKEQIDLHWLDASLYAKSGQHEESSKVLSNILKIEPWNLSYLLQDVLNKTIMFQKDSTLNESFEKTIIQLQQHPHVEVDWKEFNEQTSKFATHMQLELVYLRCKLYFLYNHGAMDSLREMTRAATKFDAEKGIYELIKLMNTNYDHPSLFWAIGSLYKDIWQLETARMWFKQGLLHPSLSSALKASIYLEIADCHIWEQNDFTKAIEYSKLALEIGIDNPMQGYITLAHAYLLTGDLRQARHLLQKVNQREYPEASYLEGLIQYRNGNVDDAKAIWKPLLTTQSESLKFHNIKQEVLKFYFDKEPYWRAN